MHTSAADHESLVAQMKDLQRNNSSGKEQWNMYVEANGGEKRDKRDPSKHDASFLQAFLLQLHSGALSTPAAGGGGAASAGGQGAMCETIKLMQKQSPLFRETWAGFTAMNGCSNRNDPAKHDPSFHAKFFESLVGGFGAGAGGPPMKRMRDGFGMGVATSGDPMKDNLVSKVKAYQRMGEEQKGLWGQYADIYLGGVRDPAKHEASVLTEFCENHGVPDSGGGGGGGGGGGNPPWRGAGGGHMAAMGGAADGVKTGLVERIKNFQRANPGNVEVWGRFSGNPRDPNRQDVAKLQEFCTMQGI